MLLSEALELAQAIADNNAGRPMNRILLAQAMNVSPSSSSFRDKIMAAYRYGLSEGSYVAEQISLTAIGDAATRPRHQEEAVTARREAFRHVPIFSQLLDHFANAKVPESKFLKNTLERPPFSIDASWSQEIADFFIENAREVGYIRTMRGANYLVVDAGTAPPPPEELDATPPQGRDRQEFEAATTEATAPPPTAKPEPSARPVPVQVFIAHGANRKPLDQLKKILNEWQVPFVVAVDEPHVGRPISEKVGDLMRSCSAGIFIFTGDETLTNSTGDTVSRPSQNVVYELGAAGLLYGRKIVVFKEKGVTFPSDFSDLGWIEFERDALDAKAMDLLRELIGLKAVRLVSSTSE